MATEAMPRLDFPAGAEGSGGNVRASRLERSKGESCTFSSAPDSKPWIRALIFVPREMTLQDKFGRQIDRKSVV